ncbi:unnamed protein product [Moneuplotes crassus]|uniref:Amino acid transporter transmembrane domain-containing protein n=1 Tax=Euplotes crassus TaxID=5936 RepID=A0AAD1X8A6_EUPCR|nr:unnamed protein product [Moneuplotes crassus]
MSCIDENEDSKHDPEVQEQSEAKEEQEVVVVAKPQKAAGIGIFMCTLTLLGTRLGGGIVGIPGANKTIGYVTFQCMMTVYAFMGMFSIWLLLRVREITGKASYPDLGIYLYGRWSIYYVNALIGLAQLGFPIIFFIVFGDVSKSLILQIDSGAGDFWTSRWFTHILLALTMLYLILQKEIQNLKYAGFALLGMITVFIVLLFLHYLISDPDPDPSEDLTDTTLNTKFFSRIPTMIASFSFQPSLFTAFASLKHKTTANGLKAGWIAIWVAYITYTITPLLGFGLFGAQVESNLLKNLSGDSRALPIILQILFLIIAIVHIPIIFFIGKEAVLIIFDEATRGSYSKQSASRKAETSDETPKCSVQSENKDNQSSSPEEDQEGGNENAPPNQTHENLIHESHPDGNLAEIQKDEVNSSNLGEDTKRTTGQEKSVKMANPKEYLNMHPGFYYLVTSICYIVVVVLSIVVGDVSVFFGIIGATAGCWIIIAGPASFYILAVHKHKVQMNTWYLKLSYILSWFYCALGFSGMVGLNICVILNA